MGNWYSKSIGLETKSTNTPDADAVYCKQVFLTNESKKLSETLDTVMNQYGSTDYNIVRIIVSYASGYIFPCCNDKCIYCKQAGVHQMSCPTLQASDDTLIYCRTLSCQKSHHKRCSNNGICSKCSIQQEKDDLIIPINDALNGILNDILINMIIDYMIGYVVKCSNDYCVNLIFFQSKWEFNTHRDKHGNFIDYYKVNKHNKLKSMVVYGDRIRIFCQNCKSNRTTCCINDCLVGDMHYTFIGTAEGINVCNNHTKCKRCGSFMGKICQTCNGGAITIETMHAPQNDYNFDNNGLQDDDLQLYYASANRNKVGVDPEYDDGESDHPIHSSSSSLDSYNTDNSDDAYFSDMSQMSNKTVHNWDPED